ncbi:MAG TPA: alcohol dehydrogenase catalytic domain-containing protein, partial [Desulfobacterales bacterium]|nr:alcohol dehydrogenase catalytic domain-containing protein [Desulfobacterales bacterium]
MRAAFVTGPMQIELRDVPTPQVPDDGLLLAVRACGVCGSDLRRWREGPDGDSTPLIAGHEIAGVVQAVGRQVTGYAVGDRLAVAPDVHCGRCWYCERGMYNLCDHLRMVGITAGLDGGMAESLPLPAAVLRGGVVHPVPAGLNDQQAALAEPLSSVLAS